MDSVTFIKLKASDADYLESAKTFGFTDGWSANMVKKSFENAGFQGYIAQINGVNVGFITATAVQDFADIESVFTHPDYRKKGIAKGLVAILEKDLKSQGVVKVLLEVRITNKQATALYNSCGFTEISKRKKYYPDGEDALVMEKELV